MHHGEVYVEVLNKTMFCFTAKTGDEVKDVTFEFIVVFGLKKSVL